MKGPAYDPDASFVAACLELCDAPLGRMLIEDIELFQKTGLGKMTEDARRALTERYSAFRSNPYADEVLRWLEGDYTFDPACLT